MYPEGTVESDIEEPEVKNSYQYMFALRKKLEDTLEIAHSELQKGATERKALL